MDTRAYNRSAWNKQVNQKNPWTIPVTPEQIARARAGDWKVVLTPQIPVPKDWFGGFNGRDLLGLASGGGQQCPIFAAAGATATVIDNSPAQLAQDRMVAERDGLAIETVEGDMADMPIFADESFDLIFHPVSNCFIPDVLPVWRECFRILRPGGALLAGMTNPVNYVFDYEASTRGELVVRHKLPYSDLTSIGDEERQKLIDDGEPLEFGHTLDDQIGGQLAAGFLLTGLYEDYWEPSAQQPQSDYMPSFLATRAVKPTR